MEFHFSLNRGVDSLECSCGIVIIWLYKFLSCVALLLWLSWSLWVHITVQSYLVEHYHLVVLYHSLCTFVDYNHTPVDFDQNFLRPLNRVATF